MPMPHPTPAESRAEFIERCMSDPVMRDEFPDTDQRVAVCASQWDGASLIGLDYPELARRLDRILERHKKPGKPREPEWRRLHRIMDRAEPHIRRAFIRAIARTQGETVLAEVERAFKAGRIDDAVDAIPWSDVGERIVKSDMLRELRDVFDQAGTVSASLIDGARFDVVDRRGLEWLREHGAELVTGMRAETKEALRETLVRAANQGLNAQRTARLVRGKIGLTKKLSAAVDNYRMRIRVENKGLSEEQIQKFTLQKAKQLLQYRAMMISRTESAFMAVNGQNEAWEQAASDEVIDREVAQRVWVTTPDDVADHGAPSCADFDGHTAKLGEPFVVTSDGTVFTVMMPPLHPHCRCSLSLQTEGGRDEQPQPTLRPGT